MKKIILLCLFIVAGFAAWAGEFPDITIPELKSAIASGKVTLLDANPLDLYQSGHIPGAVHFASSKDLKSVLPKDKNALVVAYCGGPRCHAYESAAAAAKNLGYTNIKHLVAGISGWRQAGEKTDRSS